MIYYNNLNELSHHGILNQKWGVRNGPPYPLSGGDYSPAEKRAIYKARRKWPNSIYNKKHFDETLKKGHEFKTLSYDKNRTKNTDMFYAASNKMDAHQYNALFNKPIPKPIYDKDGNEIGTGKFYKYRITNAAKHDIKVASEDSGAEIFKELYSKDRDFYNYVTDKNRMRKDFVDDKYKFRGYRQTRDVLEKVEAGKKPTEEDVKTMYRMFNYIIPGESKDVQNQRAKFFKAAKERGYGALLDTNDSIYGGFKAKRPVIVFDQEAVALKGISNTSAKSKRVSELALVGRKLLGI